MPDREALADTMAESIFNEIFHYALDTFCHEFHRMNKSQLYTFYDSPQINETVERIVDAPNKDIFGNDVHKLMFELECTNCHRMMAASRIAPHLEKCLGMGRNSSRVASRRIAERQQQQQHDVQDDESDDDWSWEKKRKRRDRNSPKRSTKKSSKDSSSQLVTSNQAKRPEERILTSDELATSSKTLVTSFSRKPAESVDGISGRPLIDANGKPIFNGVSSIRRELLPDHNEDYIDVDSYEDSNLSTSRTWEVTGTVSEKDT